ncbi:variant erythrocyte surface antigen-1 alpha subunit [Babesia bovis T2Bo]|uniref:Variant erythrocyte surface antigen-1, alpha subunit n=1 Tax=Babesia bovis TaxID=5865 RepID=A7AX29_BABBO|nr:variant erythrocyte surface antigen-1 alpha subunit [Babesia bovis T2Bo]EDO05102.1 variant erythrocyte surface antigen-1 alpha subunit [Babesia bovis T2Bo]|eukprot:XP_001608670.1 variant erythrocyte surface antigen-1, alpha subunit [Babesia bovis T2Bo]
MAVKSAFTPKASLTEAPTNLKEAIDWVLRVTGRDGKPLSGDECICGLAAAVTDLLQSVQLQYHGYQGEAKDNGASQQDVTKHLKELFSLVQGLGGTAVVRTYIDQLAQVLSALVGWSKIEKCSNGGKDKCQKDNKEHHGQNKDCEYLKDVRRNDPCTDCGCMKWDDPKADSNEGHHLGRRCTKCKDSGGSQDCNCDSGGGCQGPDQECKCAKAGKCCKCGCKGGCNKCGQKDRECSCDGYMSAYPSTSCYTRIAFVESRWVDKTRTWKTLGSSTFRSKCARILLGSVCLIWSGLTYMYWTGKYTKTSPYWNNHILDGSGLDDGTLSQWLQALGFPRDMLNNGGPGNRLDAVITNEFRDKFLLGFLEPGGLDSGVVKDDNGNTARAPFGMNYPGFIHTIHRDSFNTDQATVFPNGNGSGTTSGTTNRISDTDQNKNGAIFKLYILSCAYFTGLQKKNSESTTSTTANNPKTIREILYWLSALPYSQAYPKILKHGKQRLKEVTKKTGETESGTDNDQKQLSFLQTGRSAPITVHEYNLFAHFQAVTQYCPLVLIGIQGGIHSTNNTTPAIHSLYANTECHFTYPTVSIQAYNQVVHYIRALFYQLYFLRKQCAVKVSSGGKWRECRYGHGVVSKGVISWMCLGCDPMEHDRNYRVENMKKGLDEILKGLVKKVEGEEEEEDEKDLADGLNTLLVAIGQVVVQLGNAQEALEGKDKEGIKGVIKKLEEAKGKLETELTKVKDRLNGKLQEATKKLGELTKGSGGKESGSIASVTGSDGLDKAASDDFDQGKNRISEVIHKVREALKEIQKELGVSNSSYLNGSLSEWVANTLHKTIDQIKDICNSPKCPSCKSHSTKCGKEGKPTICKTCNQQYMDGKPSPLQAFLEDRLPGFSCREVPADEDPEYPPAADHLGHCNGSGQCCPLPMGFRDHFQQGITHTGQRLYGILYFFSNENMMQSCVYTLVRVTAALSATTPQVLGDVFGFFRGGVGNKDRGKTPNGSDGTACNHDGNPSGSYDENKDKYFCGWCASGLREEVKKIEWVFNGTEAGGQYMGSVGKALRDIKGDKGDSGASQQLSPSALSTLTDGNHYVSPLTGELYTAVSATFGGTYLSWVLYLSDALEGGLQSLASAFQQIECRGCTGCDPNKCKKGEHGQGSGQCGCQSIVSCTGVLPVLYRHGFSYGNPFNLEGYHQKDGNKEEHGQFDIENKHNPKNCHQFLDSLSAVINKKENASQEHPLTKLLSEVGQLQYDIRLPWIFVLTLAWLVAVLYLAFGAIWPLEWTHMRSHWLRGGEHQWQCMWYKVMTGRKGVELIEYFGRQGV